MAGDDQVGPPRDDKAKLKPADVKAIGLSGQMHGSVFLDKNDKVIRRAILWNDQRTAAECGEMEERAGGREQPDQAWWPIRRMTGFTAPKILWLRNHEPKTLRQDAARCCCPRTTSAAA